MKEKLYIGIDPGMAGGIAVLGRQVVVDIMVMPATPADILDTLRQFSNLASSETWDVVACLEDVGKGMPGQSSSATAKFARHCGHLEMALLSLGITTVTVTPQKWQRMYQLGKSSEHTKTEWKNRLKAKAQQLFPQQSKNITLKTADALLIAEYARKSNL